MADSRLDTKLDHLLTNYFLAIGNTHKVRKMFSENDFYQFEEFTSCDKQALTEMQRKKNNAMVGFNNRKITLIHDVVLYYHFLQSETATKALAEDPIQWVRDDFKTWRDQGRHPNIASFNTLSSSNTTNTTAPPATTVAPEIKTLEDAWMSWQRSRRDPEKYPILPNNRKYTDWIILIKRQFEADRCTRVIDDSFKDIDVKWGANDTILYKSQLNHMSIVLERVLQTTDGKRFTRKHKDEPVKFENFMNYTNACQQLSQLSRPL